MKSLLLACAFSLFTSSIIAQNHVPRNIYCLKELGCELVDSALMQKVAEKCRYSENRGKTVGVFGGSLSVNKESQAAKRR